MFIKIIIKLFIRLPIKTFNAIWNYRQLKYYNVKYGSHIKINGRIHIHGKGKIKIGDYFVMNSGSAYNPSSGGTESHFSVELQGQLIIGKHVGMSNIAISAWQEVRIGDYVMIGSNCMITDTDFHSLNFEERLNEINNWFIDTTTLTILRNKEILSQKQQIAYNGAKVSPVKIGNGVFIGARTIILKGVSIGDHAIIGAGSIVVKSIGNGEIWAGNPAIFIKKVDQL